MGSDPNLGKIGSDPIFGFTLIEVLVVVAIAGVLVAVAAVNLFPSDEQAARREAGNVALAIEHARDAAWFGGLPTSVTFTDQRVREWRLAGSEWRHASQHDRVIPPEVRLVAVHVDGLPLAPQDRLVFLSDGLGLPFRVALEARGLRYAIEGDAAGAVRLVTP